METAAGRSAAVAAHSDAAHRRRRRHAALPDGRVAAQRGRLCEKRTPQDRRRRAHRRRRLGPRSTECVPPVLLPVAPDVLVLITYRFAAKPTGYDVPYASDNGGCDERQTDPDCVSYSQQVPFFSCPLNLSVSK